ncbi:hypothetical protein Cni_G23020 [Canna indica]|uniref:Endonuclease/exonuclease/phosphatase n=1 Tax=Canna indica TaxID=4628 RepID=A0AAQ3KTN0_9LILI|nr:hypothetical protein Cni_G23020 [Canna indica]
MVMVRLDKAYANGDWLTRYSRTQVIHLSKMASDHRPILIDARRYGMQGRRNRSFVFELYWFEYKDICDKVKEAWKFESSNGLKMDEFERNLFKLGRELTEISKTQIGSLEKSLKITMGNWRF